MPPRPAPRSPLAAALLALGLASPAVMAQTTQTAQTAPTAQSSTRLDPIRVVSAQERADGPVDGYRATRSASATRTDTAIEDIPQTVTVISAQVIDDLDLSRIDRALDFAGGVIRGNNFGGVSLDSYTVRGFDASMAYNGFTSRTNTRGPEDSSVVERIEVLKGPSAGLFGQGDPGGLIHIVTKRPQAEAFNQVRLSGGSWNRYRGTLDVNTPLSADGSLLSRVNIAVEDNGSFRDHVTSDRQFISPALRWQISPDTSLLLHTEFMRTKTVFDRGIVPIGGNYDLMRRSTFLGEPNDGHIKTDDQVVQAILEHAITPDWNLRVAHQYRHGVMGGFSTEPNPDSNPNIVNDGMVPRRSRMRNWRWHSNLSHAELVGRFDLGGVQHQLLLGAEYEHNYEFWDFSGSPILPGLAINAFNPVYGAARPPFNLDGLTNRLASRALNLQDQVTFNERLTGQFGVRWDRYKQRGTTLGVPGASVQKEDALVPRAGLMYKITPDVGVFGNVSTSFKPNGISETGQTREPEKGVGFETGVKFDAMGGRLGATLAAFHITKKNLVMTDPADITGNSTITAGKAVSKGFDVHVNGQVTQALSLIGSWAYTAAKTTRGNASIQGRELLNVPRHTASLLGSYEFQTGTLQGVNLGAGVSYISTRRISNRNTSRNLRLPGYSVVDVFARWPVNKSTSVSLNVNNLFDRRYIESALDTRGGVVGAPFNVKLGVSFML